MPAQGAWLASALAIILCWVHHSGWVGAHAWWLIEPVDHLTDTIRRGLRQPGDHLHRGPPAGNGHGCVRSARADGGASARAPAAHAA